MSSKESKTLGYAHHSTYKQHFFTVPKLKYEQIPNLDDYVILHNNQTYKVIGLNYIYVPIFINLSFVIYLVQNVHLLEIQNKFIFDLKMVAIMI